MYIKYNCINHEFKVLQFCAIQACKYLCIQTKINHERYLKINEIYVT